MSVISDLFGFKMDKDNAYHSIQTAFIAGLFVGGFNLILILLSLTGVWNLGLTFFSFVDVLFVFGLSYGIYKKSRITASLMVVYYLVNKIIIFLELEYIGATSGMIAIIFSLIFIRGAVATFVIRKKKRK